MEGLQKALKIFRIILEEGEIKRQEKFSLYKEFAEEDVRIVLNAIEKEFSCRFLDLNESIYLIPEIDSKTLNLSFKNFKDFFYSNTSNSELYLYYYIFMYMLYEFYNGKNNNPKKITFLKVSNLINRLDDRFMKYEKLSSEEIQLLEEQFKVNIKTSAELWRGMIISQEQNNKKNKITIIQKLLNVLSEQNLARIFDDDEIRTTDKLDALMSQFYLKMDRIREINSAFERGEL